MTKFLLISEDSEKIKSIAYRLQNTKEDFNNYKLLTIPMPGGTESLNASVAAALMIYEVIRN